MHRCARQSSSKAIYTIIPFYIYNLCTDRWPNCFDFYQSVWYASRTKYLAVDLAKPTSDIKEIDKARAFWCSLEYQLYKVHTRMKTACEKRTKANSLRASSSDSQITAESELLSESTRTSYGHEEKTSDQHSWHADSTKLRNRCLPSDGNKGPKVYLGNGLQSLELRKGRMMIPCNNDSGPLSHGNNLRA